MSQLNVLALFTNDIVQLNTFQFTQLIKHMCTPTQPRSAATEPAAAGDKKKANKPGRAFLLTQKAQDHEVKEMIQFYLTLPTVEPRVRYICFQLEEGGTTGYLHFQIYLELNCPERMTAVKKIMQSKDVHVTQEREGFGSRQAMRDYCRKTETRYAHAEAGPYEAGKWNATGAGNRTDLDHMCQMVTEGKTDTEIMTVAPTLYVKYHKGIAAMRANTRGKGSGPDRPDVKTICVYGPGGCGKSTWARNLASQWSLEVGHDGLFFRKSLTGQWFDGYVDEKVVILDEMPNGVPYDVLKMLLEPHPTIVNIKGTTRPWHATHVIMVSNKHPHDWYPEEVDKTPLNWRIHKLHEAFNHDPEYQDDQKLAPEPLDLSWRRK